MVVRALTSCKFRQAACQICWGQGVGGIGAQAPICQGIHSTQQEVLSKIKAAKGRLQNDSGHIR